jgi:hypothetical protein
MFDFVELVPVKRDSVRVLRFALTRTNVFLVILFIAF